MNRLKKATFGVLIAGLAFGFSAFTTIKKRSVLIYYKTDLTYPNANDPRGYAYYESDMCSSGGNICSAKWDIGSNGYPTNDGVSLPLTGVTFQTGTTYSGHFEP
jgi:hypothetical protein